MRWHRGKDQIKCFAQLWDALEIHLWFYRKLSKSEGQKNNIFFKFRCFKDENGGKRRKRTCMDSRVILKRPNSWVFERECHFFCIQLHWHENSKTFFDQFQSAFHSFFISKHIWCLLSKTFHMLSNALDSYKITIFDFAAWKRDTFHIESIFELFPRILNFFLIFRKST